MYQNCNIFEKAASVTRRISCFVLQQQVTRKFPPPPPPPPPLLLSMLPQPTPSPRDLFSTHIKPRSVKLLSSFPLSLLASHHDIPIANGKSAYSSSHQVLPSPSPAYTLSRATFSLLLTSSLTSSRPHAPSPLPPHIFQRSTPRSGRLPLSHHAMRRYFPFHLQPTLASKPPAI